MAAAAPLCGPGRFGYLGIALGAGLAISLAALGGGIGQGIAMRGALEGIAATPMPQTRSSPRWSLASLWSSPSSSTDWWSLSFFRKNLIPPAVSATTPPLPVPKPKFPDFSFFMSLLQDQELPSQMKQMCFPSNQRVHLYSGFMNSSTEGEPEFAEYREYRTGEDLRRFGLEGLREVRPVLLRQRDSHTPARVRILLDDSSSMRMQSEGARMSKLRQALLMVFGLSFILQRQGDPFSFHALSMNKLSAEARSSKRAWEIWCWFWKPWKTRTPSGRHRTLAGFKKPEYGPPSISDFMLRKKSWKAGSMDFWPWLLKSTACRSSILLNQVRSPTQWYSIWNNPAKSEGFRGWVGALPEKYEEHQQWLGKARRQRNIVWEAFKPTSPPRRRSGCWWGKKKEEKICRLNQTCEADSGFGSPWKITDGGIFCGTGGWISNRFCRFRFVWGFFRNQTFSFPVRPSRLPLPRVALHWRYGSSKDPTRFWLHQNPSSDRWRPLLHPWDRFPVQSDPFHPERSSPHSSHALTAPTPVQPNAAPRQVFGTDENQRHNGDEDHFRQADSEHWSVFELGLSTSPELGRIVYSLAASTITMTASPFPILEANTLTWLRKDFADRDSTRKSTLLPVLRQNLPMPGTDSSGGPASVYEEQTLISTKTAGTRLRSSVCVMVINWRYPFWRFDWKHRQRRIR